MSNFFNPEADYQIYRRNLPHWRQDGVTYFVTFRLADSLPTKKLAALKEEKERWLALYPSPHTPNQIKEFHSRFSEQTHKWLDAGYGSCVLAQPKICQLMQDVLSFFNGRRYLLGKYIVMPNHIHVLVKPLPNFELDRILHSWKSFSANQINKMSGSRGRVWHPESFDHIVRSAAHLEHIERYMGDNAKSLPLHGDAQRE
jgi:REP element-mobilizing transposase RayT